MIGDIVHYLGNDPDNPSDPDVCNAAIVRAENPDFIVDLTIFYQTRNEQALNDVPLGGVPGTWHPKH